MNLLQYYDAFGNNQFLTVKGKQAQGSKGIVEMCVDAASEALRQWEHDAYRKNISARKMYRIGYIKGSPDNRKAPSP